MLAKLLKVMTWWRLVVLASGGLLLAAAWLRFTGGLGAVTNLNDRVPWGLWIGFDVLVGVGLAAGGFCIAAAVHLFHMERYEHVAKPAVLTAFLGYLLVCVGLLFDLGLPWNIWHPIIMWNPHSVMFEVGWCVICYTTVLGLEFSPIVFERFGWTLPLKIVRAGYTGLVVLGVLFSMMHQSSLGTLFVIVPDKLYGLWYTPWLPVFFFLTAVAGGLAMTILESNLSFRAFGHKLDDDLLDGMGRVIVVVLAVFFVWKVEDLANQGTLALVFERTPESVLFWGEMGLGVLLPMALFGSEKIRRDRSGRFFAALLVVIGFVVGRLNVAITGMQRASGVDYFPAFWEIAISVSLCVLGFAAFGFAVKNLDVFPKGELAHARPPAEISAWSLRALPTTSPWGIASLWALLAAGVWLVLGTGAPSATAQPPATTPAAVAAPAPAPVPVAAPPAGAPAAATSGAATPAPVPALPTQQALAGGKKLPADYIFPMAAGSPGPCTFSHARHMAAKDAPKCPTCHGKDGFRTDRPGALKEGLLNMETMGEGKTCGACHDGKRVFGVEDDATCEKCHPAR